MKLKENLTFAILLEENSWRTDLTIRFAEYFSHKYNGEAFMRNVIFPENFDAALEECQTDYLLVLQSGFVPSSERFFEALDEVAEREVDMFVGLLHLAEDYAVLNRGCTFINMLLWKALGSPTYKSACREGPMFKVNIGAGLDKYPAKLHRDDANPRQFIPGSAAHLGSEFTVRQLEHFGEARSLYDILGKDHFFYISCESPYHEVHTETIFEKRFLDVAKRRVFAVDHDDYSALKNVQADVVVSSAQGLKPLMLASIVRASKVIIYDSNPLALELQRLIFSIDEPTIYGDIIEALLDEHPDLDIVGDWEKERYTVVKPLLKAEVEYHLCDAFTYQMEQLLASVDPRLTAVFDISDIFVYPFNFYKRPLYQVQGFFVELYSLMRGRLAPAYVLGFSPGFQVMDDVAMNSAMQFELAKELDKIAIEEAELEERKKRGEIIPEPEEHVLPAPFAPTTSAEKIPEPVIEIRKERPKLEPRRTSQTIMTSMADLASEQGYERALVFNDEQQPISVMSKNYDFEEFPAVYEYHINEVAQTWVFKVGRVGAEKRIDFSNGTSRETFAKHLNMTMKINPKTAVKYFPEDK